MCVIAYKAKDVRFPSAERIRECWDANPDGAGIMWRDNNTNKIKFVKGFMSIGKLEKFIRKHKDMLEESECALHFRITTHGGTSKGNCHPFVCDCDADPHTLRGEADFVLMHNGILPVKPRRADISDSAELALRIGRYADPMDVMDILDELCVGSRVIVFGPEGTMMYGDKFKTVGNDGILYSNDHFVGYYGWYGRARPALGFGKCDAGKPNRIVEYNYGVVWDDTIKHFVDAETGIKVELDDIDPDFLCNADYDRYLVMMAERDSDKIENEDSVCYDPELVEEAHYYGMSVKEYIKWCYETNSADKKTEPQVSGDVVACM